MKCCSMMDLSWGSTSGTISMARRLARSVVSNEPKVCYGFHIARRKLVNFVRLNRPKVASQLSECGGAGTGCGWCIPFLKQIFHHGATDLEQLTPEEYELPRADY